MITDMTDVLGLAALDVDLDPTPTTGRPEAQGDILLIPWPDTTAPNTRHADTTAAQPVTSPITLVQGRGGNAHLLLDPDRCGIAWHPYPDGQTIGVIVVPDGGRACVDHAEHGRTAIGPGVWVARRQREQADEIRAVED